MTPYDFSPIHRACWAGMDKATVFLWRAPRAMGGGGLAASCSHDVRLQSVTIVSRFARMTRRRDTAATPSRPSGGLPWVAPTAVILPPLRGSNVNIVFTVGFAAPKGLASPTSKFHSPLRDCSRALTGAMVGGGLAASYAHNVRLQAVTIVSRFARMTRRRDAAATPSRPSGGMPWVAPTGVILPPLRGSNVNIVFTVGFAAPKALASPTSKFHSPLRGFVARSARMT